MKCWCRLGVLAVAAIAATTPLHAQTVTENRPRHLLSDAAVSDELPTHRPASGTPATPDHVGRFEIPAALKSLTDMLTASRQMRATDVTVGAALLAAATRRRHPVSSAAVIGFEAIRLGLRKPNHVERSYDVHPEVSRHRIAVTITKTF